MKHPERKKTSSYLFYGFPQVSKNDIECENVVALQEWQSLCNASFAYYRGDFEAAKKCYQSLNEYDSAKLTASSLAMAAAISTGDYGLFNEIHLELNWKIEHANNEKDRQILSIPFSMAVVAMGIPVMAPEWLKVCDFSLYSPELRPYLLYLHLMYLRGSGQYDALLSGARIAVSMNEREDSFSVLDIYFALLEGVAAVALKQMDVALHCVEKAVSLAVPRKMLIPLAEYLPGLGGILEEYLQQMNPLLNKQVSKLAPELRGNWMSFHNRFTRNHITTILTNQEYHVALLLARGASYADAAKVLCLSISRIRNIVSAIYEKLHVNNKKEMSKFIL